MLLKTALNTNLAFDFFFFFGFGFGFFWCLGFPSFKCDNSTFP